MRLNPRRRPGMATLDAVLCAVVTVGLATAGYALVRTALGSHLAFIEAAVGLSLM